MEITFQKYLCRECGKAIYIDRKEMCHAEKVTICPICEKKGIIDLVGYITNENLTEQNAE